MPLLANFEIKAMAKGIAEGKAEGKLEGKLEGKAEIVLRMHSKGLPITETADLNSLSVLK